MADKENKVAYKFPKNLGACADRMKELDAEQAKRQRLVDAVKKEYDALEAHVISQLEGIEAEGVAGKKAKAKINRKEVPIVKDWDAFYKYVRKTGDFSLMQKRLSSSAVRERWEDRKKVPGLDKFIHKSISLTKA